MEASRARQRDGGLPDARNARQAASTVGWLARAHLLSPLGLYRCSRPRVAPAGACPNPTTPLRWRSQRRQRARPSTGAVAYPCCGLCGEARKCALDGKRSGHPHPQSAGERLAHRPSRWSGGLRQRPCSHLLLTPRTGHTQARCRGITTACRAVRLRVGRWSYGFRTVLARRPRHDF